MRSFSGEAMLFATVIDDFVISQFLSADASSETVPMKIYSSLRATATPAVNALATVMLLFTLTAILLVPRVVHHVHQDPSHQPQLDELT